MTNLWIQPEFTCLHIFKVFYEVERKWYEIILCMWKSRTANRKKKKKRKRRRRKQKHNYEQRMKQYEEHTTVGGKKNKWNEKPKKKMHQNRKWNTIIPYSSCNQTAQINFRFVYLFYIPWFSVIRFSMERIRLFTHGHFWL